MITVDTNVLVRILVDDEKEPTQIKLARQWAERTKEIFISQIVQVELIWVLKKVYRTAKEEIIRILDSLLENEAFVIQNEHSFEEALHLYRESNVDFSDCLILAGSHHSECKVVTFDKTFSKLPKVELLT